MAKPILRWVGGKARLLPRLRPMLPAPDAYQRFLEPFVGGGSVFFALEPERAILGDANCELMRCYRWVRNAPRGMAALLLELQNDQTRETYYLRRKEFSSLSGGMRKAALFIYLNKTSFNGIWRVNKLGEYNVPYGAKERPGFPSASSLLEASALLKRSELIDGDFHYTLQQARPEDFVFLDPPYRPSSSTAFFRHYTSERFGDDDHRRLRDWVHDADRAGVMLMLTISADDLAVGDYGSLKMRRWSVQRYVSASAKRQKANELVITNW